MNRSSSNPGSLTPASLTPAPSGSSLSSLRGFNCSLPPLNIDAIDSIGGDCSTTSSPRHVSSAHNAAQFISATSEEARSVQFGNPLSLGGLSSHYVLGDEGDIFCLPDHTAAGAYLPRNTEESRELIPGQSPLETPTQGLSALPFASAGLDPVQNAFYPAHFGPMQYSSGISLPSVLLYTQQYPFLQESRASNQNTPIGSPQPHGGTF